MGKIILSALISDGMVLQRNTENTIWGYAEPEKWIQLTLDDYQTVTQANKNGYFEFLLPQRPEGGPWEILLSDGTDCTTIHDVLFGDVFLLGGQSNMELPVARTMERYCEEIRQTKEPEIRMFEVPKEYSFGSKREELENGCWLKAVGEELQLFSAVGYFAAKELHAYEEVPIGLIQSAVGGTPVKAWCKEETVRELGYDTQELEECKQIGYPQQVEEQEAKYCEMWWENALSKTQDKVETGSVVVPGFFQDTGLEDFCGGICLTKTVILKSDVNWEQEEVTLYLGALIDADITYVNGKKIGETEYRYPPRIYTIPKGTLHAGENEITIKMLVFGNAGGFMPGKKYCLCYGKENKGKIELSGAWNYKIIRRMNSLPETTFFQYKAAGLYQGMLYPLRKWKLKGCFFYQGESNTGRPETYQTELEAMIRDWRELWKAEALPFLYVQLAGFGDGKESTIETNWAYLREAQRQVQNTIANTKMVQAYDLGEYNDLHPTDKKTVGQRIALAAEKFIYGKPVLYEDSEVAEVEWKENCAEVTFFPRESELQIGLTKQKNDTVRGFEVVYEDGTRKKVEAKLIQGAVKEERIRTKVNVPFLTDKKITALCYAWNNCPLDANLYNEAGLPVVPFYVEKK